MHEPIITLGRIRFYSKLIMTEMKQHKNYASFEIRNKLNFAVSWISSYHLPDPLYTLVYKDVEYIICNIADY